MMGKGYLLDVEQLTGGPTVDDDVPLSGLLQQPVVSSTSSETTAAPGYDGMLKGPNLVQGLCGQA